MGRTQRVVVDGEASAWVPVESGVPQGTVLGPQLFLAFINNLPKAVSSRVRLFADDCVLYRKVETNADCHALQEDLRSLEEWERHRCMSFNAAKCSSIAITRKQKKVLHQYSLHNQILECVDSIILSYAFKMRQDYLSTSYLDQKYLPSERSERGRYELIQVTCAEIILSHF